MIMIAVTLMPSRCYLCCNPNSKMLPQSAAPPARHCHTPSEDNLAARARLTEKYWYPDESFCVPRISWLSKEGPRKYDILRDTQTHQTTIATIEIVSITSNRAPTEHMESSFLASHALVISSPLDPSKE